MPELLDREHIEEARRQLRLGIGASGRPGPSEGWAKVTPTVAAWLLAILDELGDELLAGRPDEEPETGGEDCLLAAFELAGDALREAGGILAGQLVEVGQSFLRVAELVGEAARRRREELEA